MRNQNTMAAYSRRQWKPKYDKLAREARMWGINPALLIVKCCRRADDSKHLLVSCPRENGIRTLWYGWAYTSYEAKAYALEALIHEEKEREKEVRVKISQRAGVPLREIYHD